MRDRVRDSEGRFALHGLRCEHGGAVFGSAFSDRSRCAGNGLRFQPDALFGTDFMPLIRHGQTQRADERIACADECAALQLGQIEKKLGRLMELMEKREG